jgi:hypothetical protein
MQHTKNQEMTSFSDGTDPKVNSLKQLGDMTFQEGLSSTQKKFKSESGKTQHEALETRNNESVEDTKTLEHETEKTLIVETESSRIKKLQANMVRSREIHRQLMIKKNRWRPNDIELSMLKSHFQDNQYPTREEKEGLLGVLNQKFKSKIEINQLSLWFQHEREKDCSSSTRKNSYKKFTPEELEFLKENFNKNTYPKTDEMIEIAKKLCVTLSKIENWYKHNRRSLAKKGVFTLKTKKYFKKDEVNYLVKMFETYPRPSKDQITEISAKLSCSEAQVKNWYSNKRKKMKMVSRKNENGIGTSSDSFSQGSNFLPQEEKIMPMSLPQFVGLSGLQPIQMGPRNLNHSPKPQMIQIVPAYNMPVLMVSNPQIPMNNQTHHEGSQMVDEPMMNAETTGKLFLNSKSIMVPQSLPISNMNPTPLPLINHQQQPISFISPQSYIQNVIPKANPIPMQNGIMTNHSQNFPINNIGPVLNTFTPPLISNIPKNGLINNNNSLQLLQSHSKCEIPYYQASLPIQPSHHQQPIHHPMQPSIQQPIFIIPRSAGYSEQPTPHQGLVLHPEAIQTPNMQSFVACDGPVQLQSLPTLYSPYSNNNIFSNVYPIVYMMPKQPPTNSFNGYDQ